MSRSESATARGDLNVRDLANAAALILLGLLGFLATHTFEQVQDDLKALDDRGRACEAQIAEIRGSIAARTEMSK